MAILNVQTVQTGLVGILPSLAYIYTTDTEATALTAGYLNKEVQQGVQFQMPCIAAVSTQATPTSKPVVGWYNISHSGSNWSLTPTGSPGSVTIPTIANHIATYTDALGSLGEDPATAISGGNIQAGLSGTAGYLSSFPLTASKGSLRVTAVANTGDTLVTISNALHGQASVYSIPDSGATTANFIISKLSGTQHITVGSLEVDAGNLIAGISGTAGTFISFPATAANGTLILAAANSGGAFNTTISNGTMGQSTVYSMGDIGASTGGLVVATSAIRMKSVAGAAAAGGAAAQSFTDAFCTTGSNVIGNWNTQANAASVLKIVPGNGSFVVTSSADAGVGTFNYIITK
jgi:hypothetical protein